MAKYTEEQRTIFVALAAEVGMAPARERLGYPSGQTASEWCKNYGVDTAEAETPLMKRAKAMRMFYGQQEKMTLLQEIMDAAYRLLEWGRDQDPVISEEGEVYYPLGPLDVQRLATAVRAVIQTGELLEGRPTEIVQEIDPTDTELRKLVEEFRQRNDGIRQQFSGR